MQMNDDDKQILEYWHSNEGAFTVVDYVSENILTTAKGKLDSVSPKGDVIIKHLNDPHKSWSFNIFRVTINNSKFSPLRGENDE